MLRNPVFKFFASLKLAVICILMLATVLASATIFESMYGMRASHVMVYGTPWFAGVLFLLGLNVLCAAISRYPWKRRQLGFVLTHLGIITMLLGAMLTERFGVDGNLPVVQGDKENQVILTDLKLSLADEDGKSRREIPVPETGRESSGKLLKVDLGGGASLVMDRFLPRTTTETVVKPSQLAGVDIPSLHVELFNSRFRVQEWLFHSRPDKVTEINLGPALLTFRKLWTPAEKDAFFEAATKKEQGDDPYGYLVFDYLGKELRVGVKSGLKHWTKLGNSGLQVRVDQYLPYAIVQNNELISKSNEPVNPAAHLTVRGPKGAEEKHTVFINFPEFSTLHRQHRKPGQPELGVKVRMVAPNGGQSLNFVGNNRGRLEFAQSSDDKHLYYLVLNASGAVTGKGEAKAGDEIPTGWMDLKFHIRQWVPAGVAQEVPHYVDEISGMGDTNYVSAIHVKGVESRGSAAQSDGEWITEGTEKIVTIGSRRMVVYYGRERLPLPFFMYLKKFTMGTDPGTTKAATYASDVAVQDTSGGVLQEAKISMNEPLDYGGYTFYQASYQMQEGQAPISVFAVNYDPGRKVKYLGAIIMVFGILIMFYMNPHYLDKLLKPKGVSA